MNEILYEVRDGIALITLNRPAQRNALSIAASERLYDLWGEIDQDKTVKAAVITASECGVFCAGMDLKDAARVQREHGTDILQTLRDPFFERMRNVAKPLIAALNGHFTAGGMVLAANCDLRVGKAGSHAGIAEARVGRGSPWAVPMLWQMPQAILMEMVLTGAMQPTERLHEIGFLNYLEPDSAAVLARAIELNPRLRIQARTDPDFLDMVDDPRFTELLYPEVP